MKYFSEIIRILERFRERRTDTVDTDFRAQFDNKEFQLYDGIRTDAFPNDFEAADALYQSPPTDTRYSSTKNRLKVRMLNSLFHLNLRRAGFSESAQAYYRAHRSVLVVEVLGMLGAERVAKHIAETTIRHAQKFSLTDVELSMAIFLRRLAGNAAKQKEFEKWDAIISELFLEYYRELLSTKYADKMVIIFWKYSGNLSRFVEEFTSYEKELHEMLNEKSTYTFRLNYYRVLVYSRYASNNSKEVIKASQDAITFLQSNPKLLQKGRVAEFWLHQLEGHLGTHDYQAAEVAAKEYEALASVGSNRWFSFADSYFFLLTNTLRFVEAKDFYDRVTTHTRFKEQGDILQERFDIYKFYLNFALRTLPEFKDVQLPKLNFDLMIYNATESKRDKAGMNMALRFAQILHLFELKDYDRIDNLIEPIQTYRSRFIIASQTEQSTIFFRLIKMMVRSSYQYKDCLRHGMKLHNELKTGKFENVNQEQEVQILPYAWMWEYMLDKMKERTVR